MAHARQQIREAVVVQVTGLATTGTNVFDSRVYPVDEATLPCLAVYATSEELSDEFRGRKSERDLVVVVEARAQATAALEDQLDTICAEVEAALGGDRSLGGLVMDLEIESTEIELDDEGKKPTGMATMNWRAAYRVDPSDAETIL